MFRMGTREVVMLPREYSAVWRILHDAVNAGRASSTVFRREARVRPLR